MGFELQSKFRRFHENIKLNDLDQNSNLREKRNMLVQEVQTWLRKNGKPSVKAFNQGSYAMGTGILPTSDRDYDIDVGLIFDINVHDYPDPTVVKGWVETALSNSPRTVVMKDACVRVQYHRRGDTHYHVDFAVYGENRYQHGWPLQIAKGRRGSASYNKKWETSRPRKLKDLINSRFTNAQQKQQFKRIIRYLKKWKDMQFKAIGDGAPTGIALTAIAYEWFQPSTNGDRDLVDLYELLKKCINSNYGLDVRLPVEPYNDLFERITNSHNHTRRYKQKIDALYSALANAYNAYSEADAIIILRQQFGNDFPS